MRYIGNKTKLLSFIGSVLDDLGIKTGTAADPFAGTSSVAQFLKRRGFQVASSDIMTYSYVFQRAYVELDYVPTFDVILHEDPDLHRLVSQHHFQNLLSERFGAQADLFDAGSEFAQLRQVLLYLDSFLPPMNSFVTEQYSATEGSGGEPGRMFFTRHNGTRIDAIRTRIHEWWQAGQLTEDEMYLLLALLLEAADNVANTTGVYAAYVKSWQANAVKPLRLEVPELVTGTKLTCRAHLQDAYGLIQNCEPLDVLYLDPPYNTRQYSSYYHVPEVIATGWFDQTPVARGKTGLVAELQRKSEWSVAVQCEDVFRTLIRDADARFVLLSYNSEGIIRESTIETVLREYGLESSYRVFDMRYARYRSDSDSDQRAYKTDEVTEYVYTTALSRD